MEDILKHRKEVQENILKSFGVEDNENVDIEKARSGVYEDTSENRRLGRVGQQYGSKKEQDYKSYYFTVNGKKVEFFEDKYGLGGLKIDGKEISDSNSHFTFDEEGNLQNIYANIDNHRRIMITVPKNLQPKKKMNRMK